MNGLTTTAKKYNMSINSKKTKMMLVSKVTGGVVTVVVEGQTIEQVKFFKYLGAMIIEDGRCETEVKVRIAMAKEAFNKRKELLSRRMSIAVNTKTVKIVVWSVALYGC